MAGMIRSAIFFEKINHKYCNLMQMFVFTGLSFFHKNQSLSNFFETSL